MGRERAQKLFFWFSSFSAGKWVVVAARDDLLVVNDEIQWRWRSVLILLLSSELQWGRFEPHAAWSTFWFLITCVIDGNQLEKNLLG